MVIELGDVIDHELDRQVQLFPVFVCIQFRGTIRAGFVCCMKSFPLESESELAQISLECNFRQRQRM